MNCHDIIQIGDCTMAKTAIIQARIDPEVKEKAKEILNKLHLSMSEAISLYLTQVALQKGIPFDIKIPNELTAETIRKSEKGEDLHQVDSVDELFKELNS
jgi:DNA-damage-inducible protein J